MTQSAILFPQPNSQWAKIATDLVDGVHTLVVGVSGAIGVPMSAFYDFNKTTAENTLILDAAFRLICGMRKQHVIVDRPANGQPYLLSPDTPSWKEFGPSSLPAQRAITIDYDDFWIEEGGGTVKMVAPVGGQTPGGKCYAFSTLQNFTIGAVKRFTAIGRFYDHNSFSTSPLLSSNYTFCICGMDYWTLLNYTGYNSSNSTRGATMAMYNCRNGLVKDMTQLYLAQGFNANYIYWTTFSGINAKRFGEAIDINYQAYDTVFENIIGDNTGEGGDGKQLLDFCGQRATMTNVIMNGGGSGDNCIAIYAKGKAWNSYQEHVEKYTELYQQQNPNPIGIEDVIVDGVIVKNTDIDEGYPFLFVSNRRIENIEGVGGIGDGTGGTILGQVYLPVPVPKRVTVRNVYGTSCSGVAVREGTDMLVDNVVLDVCYGGSQSDFAAIRIGQQSNGSGVRAVSECSGSFTNLTVKNARHDAFLIDAMATATLSDFVADGWGTMPTVGQPEPKGIRGINFALKNGCVSIDNFTALNTNSIVQPNFHWSAQGTFTDKMLVDKGGHRFTSPQVNPVVLSGDVTMARAFKRKLLYRGAINNQPPAAATVDTVIYTQDLQSTSRWLYMTLAFGAGFTVTPTASAFFRIRKINAAGTVISLAAFTTITATAGRGTILELPNTIDMDDPGNIIAPGEQLVLSVTRDAGNIGINFTDIEVYSSSLEWMNT